MSYVVNTSTNTFTRVQDHGHYGHRSESSGTTRNPDSYNRARGCSEHVKNHENSLKSVFIPHFPPHFPPQWEVKNSV